MCDQDQYYGFEFEVQGSATIVRGWKGNEGKD